MTLPNEPKCCPDLMYSCPYSDGRDRKRGTYATDVSLLRQLLLQRSQLRREAAKGEGHQGGTAAHRKY